jgi:Leucine-rich repeat (LRR) protein
MRTRGSTKHIVYCSIVLTVAGLPAAFAVALPQSAWVRNHDLKPGDLQKIAVNKSIIALDLYDNFRLTDDDLSALAGLTQLQHLILGGTGIRGPGLRHLAAMKKLEVLGLFNTPIADEGLDVLCRLPALRDLSLESTRITGAGLAKLLACASLPPEERQQAGFSHLEVLDLSQTQVVEEGLSDLCRLPSLRVLRLSLNKVTPDGVRLLTACTGLTELDLNHTKLKGRELMPLAKLPNLQRLGVSGLPLDGDDTRALRKAMPHTNVWFPQEVE